MLLNHMTFTFNEEAIPDRIKGRFSALLQSALHKIVLVPNVLDIAYGMFKALTFEKEYLKDKPNLLTGEEKKALGLVDQFSHKHAKALPHISLMQWILGKQKKKQIYTELLAGEDSLRELLEGTGGYFKDYVGENKKRIVSKKEINEAYEILETVRQYYNFPQIILEDGVRINLNEVDHGEWLGLFMRDSNPNEERIRDFSRQFSQVGWTRKPLTINMKPLVDKVLDTAMALEARMYKCPRPSDSSKEKGTHSFDAGTDIVFYEPKDFEQFEEKAAKAAVFTEWYGTRKQNELEVNPGGIYPEKAVVQAKFGSSLLNDNPGGSDIEAAKKYLAQVKAKTAFFHNKGKVGENWPGLKKSIRKKAVIVALKALQVGLQRDILDLTNCKLSCC